jgi:hypothetical protein
MNIVSTRLLRCYSCSDLQRGGRPRGWLSKFCQHKYSVQTYSEGTHFVLPWFERPYIFDVRARPNTISSTSGSRDLQMVNVSLRVLTKPNATKLQEIYRTLGMDYDQRVLPSIIQETLKGVIAQYNAAQLLTQRELVSKDIRRMLTERAARFNIVLEDVSITNLTFSREYTAAVEAKQVCRCCCGVMMWTCECCMDTLWILKYCFTEIQLQRRCMYSRKLECSCAPSGIQITTSNLDRCITAPLSGSQP